MLISKGFKVAVLYPSSGNSKSLIDAIDSEGIIRYPFPYTPLSFNPFNFICALLSIFRSLLHFQPNLFFSYTHQSIILSLFVSQAYRLIHRRHPLKLVSYFTGLGYFFSPVKSSLLFKAKKHLLLLIYRLLSHNINLFAFQNCDDRNLFLDKSLLTSSSESIILSGSGVDIDIFNYKLPSNSPTILCLSRINYSKGIIEYIESASDVIHSFPNVRFYLAGKIGLGPDPISSDDLAKHLHSSPVTYLGNCSNVHELLAASRFVVFPSYYREGIPAAGIEALSVGRPIIATDTPGVRLLCSADNGILISPKDTQQLTLAMINMLNKDDSEILKMSQSSRKIAETFFTKLSNDQKFVAKLESIL